MVCLYLLCHLGAAWQLPVQSSISLLLLCCLNMALLHNVQLWSGVVGDICSSPPAKSPHHMVLFMRSLFNNPANVKKKKRNKNPKTHKLCPNDNRGSTITGSTFTTNPALSPQRLVLHANWDGRTSLLCAVVMSTITAVPWKLQYLCLAIFLT